MDINCEYKGKSVTATVGGYLRINGNDSPPTGIAGEVACALYRFFVDGTQSDDLELKNIQLLFNGSPRSRIDGTWVDDKTGEPTDEEVVDSMLGMAKRDTIKIARKYRVSLTEPEAATETVAV